MSALEISEKDFLIGARKGIRKSRLLSIARGSGLTLKELSSYFRISTRSIQEKAPSQLIAPGPSERALCIAKLFQKGIELFGDQDKFRNWLDSVNPAMGKKSGRELPTWSQPHESAVVIGTFKADPSFKTRRCAGDFARLVSGYLG